MSKGNRSQFEGAPIDQTMTTAVFKTEYSQCS